MTEEQNALLCKVFDNKLPELDPVYYEARKVFPQGSVYEDLVPYLMYMMYTPDEMRMILALPASVDEVAEATGLKKSYVEQSLNHLAANGRAVYKTNGFARIAPNLTVYMDYAFFKIEGEKRRLTEREIDYLKLMYLTRRNNKHNENAAKMKMRVIPKWRSIKSVPGVMPCENIREILFEHHEKNTLATNRCICNVMTAYWNYGAYPGKRAGNAGYAHEGECGGRCGHCYTMGVTAEYYRDVFNSHVPTREEVVKGLDAAEDANVIYIGTNIREISTICSCNFDYCIPYDYGAWEYIPSRFLAVRKNEKCTGCGECKAVCQFGAIHGANCEIDKDLCIGCGNCVSKCKANALKMKIVRPVSWISEIPDGPIIRVSRDD